MSEGVQDEFPELWATQPVKGVPGPGSACGGAQRWDRQAVRQPGAGGRAPCAVPADEPPASPRAQVPVIPVVYSSFSSFYDARTKLFTSGSARTASTRGLPVSLPGTPGPVSAGRGAPQGAGGGGGPSHRPVPRAGRRPPEGGWVPEFARTARAVHTAWGWRQGPPALRVGFPASASRPDSRGQQPPRPQNSGPLPSPPDPTPTAQVGQWGPRLKGGRGGARRRPP